MLLEESLASFNQNQNETIQNLVSRLDLLDTNIDSKFVETSKMVNNNYEDLDKRLKALAKIVDSIHKSSSEIQI